MGARVYREWVARDYVAGRISAAYFFWVLCLAFAILAPFFLAIASHSFWLKESTYSEQPDVRFQYKMVLLAEGTVKDSSSSTSSNPMQLFWSTNSSFNDLYQDSLRVPVIRSRTLDDNADTLADSIHISAELPLTKLESVHSVSALFLFDFRLKQRVKYRMDALGFVQQSSALPGRRLTVDADIKMRQGSALSVLGGFSTPHTRGDAPLLEPQLGTSRDLLFSSLVTDYRMRATSAGLQDVHSVWERAAQQSTAAGSVPGNFTLAATIRVPRMAVVYQPDWSETVKMAWVQYIALFAIVWYLLSALREFVYTNQILETTVHTTSAKGYAGPKLHKF